MLYGTGKTDLGQCFVIQKIANEGERFKTRRKRQRGKSLIAQESRTVNFYYALGNYHGSKSGFVVKGGGCDDLNASVVGNDAVCETAKKHLGLDLDKAVTLYGVMLIFGRHGDAPEILSAFAVEEEGARNLIYTRADMERFDDIALIYNSRFNILNAVGDHHVLDIREGKIIGSDRLLYVIGIGKQQFLQPFLLFPNFIKDNLCNRQSFINRADISSLALKISPTDKGCGRSV